MFIIHDDNSIEIVRGDSAEFDISLPIRDESGQIIEEYELQDDDTLLFTVKKNTKVKDVIFQKSGKTVLIEPSDTEDLSYGRYVYDVQLTYASGYTDTVILPTEFKVLEEVTF